MKYLHLKKYPCLYFMTAVLMISSCGDTYKGPQPKDPLCIEFPSTDTIDYARGVIKIVDTLAYISNYIDGSTDQKYYPCVINPLYRKQGFPIEYSGHVKMRDRDTKEYIELITVQPILNETVITNYKGLVRFRDSAGIAANEKNGAILDSKIENYKLKLLISYSGCTRGRTQYLSYYKTTQAAGDIKVYSYLTSPYEPCTTAFSLWYEIDVSDYKEHTFFINDGIKVHQFLIPK